MSWELDPQPEIVSISCDGGRPIHLGEDDTLEVTLHDFRYAVRIEYISLEKLEQQRAAKARISKWKRRIGWFRFQRFWKRFRPSAPKPAALHLAAAKHDDEWPDILE